MTKRISLEEAVSFVRDGDVLAIGGNTLHRAPIAFVHRLIHAGTRGLEIVKTAGSYDIDVLCAAGVAAEVSAGFVGYETPFGMAPAYRRAVETGKVLAKEHVCASVIAGLRASLQGVSFMPMAGLTGSDLPAARGFAWLENPYGTGRVIAIPAISPDVAIIHVHEADDFGNARILGSPFEDVIMAQAAKKVVITAERVVDRLNPLEVTISGLYVDAVVEAPSGAHPLSCPDRYEWDAAWLASWVEAAQTDEAARSFIDTRILDQVHP